MRSRIAGLGIAIVLVAVLGSGCNPDRNKLLFKPQPNSKRTVDTEDAFSYSMKAMGMEITMGMARENSLELQTQSVDPDGVATIQVTYKSSKVEISGLDSLLGGGMPGAMGKPGAPAADDPLGMKAVSAALKGIEGQSFTVKVNKLGEITEVDGADEIAEKAAAGLKGPMAGSAVQSKTALRQMLGDEATKNLLKPVFLQRPDKPLKSAATWQDKVSSDAGVAGITADSTYTVKDRASGVASLDTTTQLSLDMQNGPMSEMTRKMNMKVEVSGQGSGTAKVEESTGWLNDSLSTATFKGNISMQAPGGNGTFSIPIEGSYKVTIKNMPS